MLAPSTPSQPRHHNGASTVEASLRHERTLALSHRRDVGLPPIADVCVVDEMTRMIVKWTLTPMGDGWDIEPDAVVWVSVASVEKSFSLGDQWVGPGGSGCGQKSRYESIGTLFTSGLALRMPHLSLGRDGRIRFTDGRHRFAWVRDHGAEALPVTAAPERADQLSSLFGTALRVCEIELPS